MSKKKKRTETRRVQKAAVRFNRRLPLQARAIRVLNYAGAKGQITVAITKKMDAAQFWCKIADTAAGASLPDPLTTVGLFELTDIGADIFQNTAVDVENVDAVASGKSIFIAIGAYDGAGALLEEDKFDFIAVRQTSTAAVRSKSCLFFAYSADTVAVTNPPYSDEILANTNANNNRPYVAPVPIDAGRAVIAVRKNGGDPQMWTHSGGNGGVLVRVTAEGEIGDVDNTGSGYIAVELNSATINSIPEGDPADRYEGLLAAMWDYGEGSDGKPKPTQVMAVGKGLGYGATRELVKPATAEMPALNLMFGSHQESHWGKSDEALNVTVVWVD